MSESDPLETSKDEPLLEPCRHCGTELDVSEAGPLEEVSCPRCGGLTQVRLRIKNYQIESILGTGGMGSVYKARDLNLNREVALKVINQEFSRDPEHLKKFEEEARITALVNHPNVVKIFSFGSDHGVLFIAMELADKGNLDDLMTLQGKIAEVQALEVGIQIAEGLRAAHQCGLIHRDVKPGNILFAEAHTAKIVDFGLACLVDETAAASGEIWGTPYYIAPEKLNLEPEDLRSDIYSLGATLFHAIAGRPPHEAETASMVALKHIKSKAVSLQAFAPNVSGATAFVINRMLQKDPADRYQTYAELVEHLSYARTKLLEEVQKPFSARETLTLENEKEQNVVAWMVFIVLALVVMGGVGFMIFGNGISKKDDGGSLALKTPSPHTEAMEDAEEKYVRARKQIREGDADKAGKTLAALSSMSKLPQPLGQWILLHEGMAALFSENRMEAKRVFTVLQGEVALPPAEKSLANFFTEVGRLLATDTPVQPDLVKNYSLENHEAIAPFLFGLHDWELSQFDEAGALFQAFLKTDPGPKYEWISEYKPIAKKYLEDLNAYKKITTEVAAARTLQAREDVVQELQGITSPPLQPGKLPGVLQEIQADLEKKITAEKSEDERKRAVEEQKHADEQAAEHEKQSRALSDAKVKVSTLLNGMQYDEAVALVQGLKVTSKDLEDGKAVLLEKAQWLQAFKATLSSDLASAGGYPRPVVKRIGAPVSGVANKATKSQIEIQTPYGKVDVQWLEIAPSSLLAMADYFTQKNAQSESVADRLWFAGVYAFQSGQQKEGQALLDRAAEKKAEYKDALPLFKNVPPR